MPPRFNMSEGMYSFDGGKTWFNAHDFKLTDIKEEEKMNKKFKVGDKVQAIRWGFGYDTGMVGYVLSVNLSGEFIDIEDVLTHKIIRGCCSDNYERCEMPKIKIYQDEFSPKTIIAENCRTGEKAVAHCSPDDDFNFYTGARLALERLEKKDKEPEGWSGKMVCVDSGSSKFFTAGKVYSVKNGLLYDDTKTLYVNKVFTSTNDIIDYMTTPGMSFGIKMIEFKGE